MHDIPVTEPGIIKLLRNIKVKKATGPDEMSPRILEEAAEQLAPILTFISKQSFTSGQIPDDWKSANICPLHKKGFRDLAESYRPVSLTSVVSELAKLIVYSQISNHLESSSVLTSAWLPPRTFV